MNSLKAIFSEYHHTRPSVRDLGGPQTIGRGWGLQVRWSEPSTSTDALRALALALIGEARITVFSPCHVKGMVELVQRQAEK